MHVVIFTGGLFWFGENIKKTLAKTDMILAADSGAETALKYNYIPHTVLGDFDSLDPRTKNILEQKGSLFIASSREKDETDTELAIQYAIEQKATEITILGGIEGDRIDHILANIFLPISFPLPIRFMNGNTTAWVETAPKRVKILGKPNDLLSLIPLTTDVMGIKTKNLQYPLDKEPLSFGKPRGVSNVFLENHAEVTFTQGILLFVHIDKTN
jgi:thiamine pyrophosphokinase